MLEAGNQFCPATEAVPIKSDLFAADRMVRRPADDPAACVTRDGATARITYTGNRYPLYPKVGSAGADDFAAVGRGVAQPDNVFHDGCLRSNNAEWKAEVHMTISQRVQYRSLEPPSI